MSNNNLTSAKKAKNDEFYTQYHDIEKEMAAYLEFNPDVFKDKTILLPCDDPEWSNFTKYFAQNFAKLGLKKLISTSFAPESKLYKINYQPSLFETESPKFDQTKTRTNGKIFTLTADKDSNGMINVDDLDFEYLAGDGDFRTEEIKKLRDEADIIITNPPFSLFREFLAWIIEAQKQFVIIANINAITYKEVFPLIKENKIWLGTSGRSDMKFELKIENTEHNTEKNLMSVTCCWFTNLDHGRRHQPLALLTMEENRKYNSKVQKSTTAYQKYDNYNAIEVPFTDAIPSDYDGVMGVPITFLDKYNPEQFEIMGLSSSAGYKEEVVGIPFLGDKDARPLISGSNTYARIFIKNKKPD